MLDIVTQREKWDCVYCCFAMWLKKDYDEIMEAAKSIGLGTASGLNNDQMTELGALFGLKIFHLPYNFFNRDLTGIITVPSKNSKYGDHAVYYDNRILLDPQFCLPDRHWYFPNVGEQVFKKSIAVDYNDEYSRDFVHMFLLETKEECEKYARRMYVR